MKTLWTHKQHALKHIYIFGGIFRNCGGKWSDGNHDDVIKWKHFPPYWPFVRSPVNSPHKGQWRGALMFSLICVWINGWVNNREAGDLRRYKAHYDVTVMFIAFSLKFHWNLFVSLGSIDNKSPLVRITACHLLGTKPLPEQMIV